MNLQELDSLLEKYFGGLTSEGEEQRLFALLKTEKLPEQYHPDRDLLNALLDDAVVPEPDSGFEARIMGAIDESESERKIVSIKRKLYSFVSVAAMVLIIFTSYFILNRNSEPKDTFDDPILAYNATIDVLTRVSNTLNSGNDAMAKLSIIGETQENLQKLSEPARIVNREMESLKYIEKSLSILEIGKK